MVHILQNQASSDHLTSWFAVPRSHHPEDVNSIWVRLHFLLETMHLHFLLETMHRWLPPWSWLPYHMPTGGCMQVSFPFVTAVSEGQKPIGLQQQASLLQTKRVIPSF